MLHVLIPVDRDDGRPRRGAQHRHAGRREIGKLTKGCTFMRCYHDHDDGNIRRVVYIFKAFYISIEKVTS